MGRRERAIAKFEARRADLLQALRAGGHDLDFLVLEEPLTAKVFCARCNEEWRGKRAQRRGRGLTPDRPCSGPAVG